MAGILGHPVGRFLKKPMGDQSWSEETRPPSQAEVKKHIHDRIGRRGMRRPDYGHDPRLHHLSQVAELHGAHTSGHYSFQPTGQSHFNKEEDAQQFIKSGEELHKDAKFTFVPGQKGQSGHVRYRFKGPPPKPKPET